MNNGGSETTAATRAGADAPPSLIALSLGSVGVVYGAVHRLLHGVRNSRGSAFTLERINATSLSLSGQTLRGNSAYLYDGRPDVVGTVALDE